VYQLVNKDFDNIKMHGTTVKISFNKLTKYRKQDETTWISCIYVLVLTWMLHV